MNDDHEAKELKKQFVYRYLQGDGTFMLRLIVSNVSDYVCRRIIVELYRVFYQSLEKHTIGRESLFKPILVEQEGEISHEKHLEDEGGSTDQIIKPEIPPIPNPRHGRLFVERSVIFPQTSSFEKMDMEQSESIPSDSNIEPLETTIRQIRLRSSAIPLLKDIRRSSEIHIDSSESNISHYKNLESDTRFPSPIHSPIASSLPPLPPPSLKGPSPYATTYLTTRKRSEHELPYIDDSVSSGSTSGRMTSTTVVQQAEKAKTLASTNIFFRRSHDV